MSDSRPGDNEVTPPLSPPDKAATRADRHDRRFPPVIVLITLLCLLAAAGAVVILLPVTQENPPTPLEKVSSESTPVAPDHGVEPAPADDLETEATAALATALELKISAEAQGVSRWAPEAYALALEDITEAQTLMANQHFRESGTLFRQVSTDLTTLLDTKELVYQRLLESGENRLGEGDPDGAGELAERGLAIHPESEAAASLARRAQARMSVLEQFERAEELEEAGDLEQAAEILAEIMALDGTFQPAVSAAARISRILEQRAFESRMTSLYNSIERGNFSEAEKSLRLLQQSRAHDPLVIQAAQYYAEMSAAAVLSTQRRQAEQFAEAEQWREALRGYQDILQNNPGAMFAAVGVEKAAWRLELDSALVKTIAEPSRMQDREVRKRAEELLGIAVRTLPGGPRLQSQVEALQELVDWAGKEINLTLESDNQTDVTIYHVGNLGRFYSRTVKLVPGTYTIVGSRPGYRDTRKTVKIGTEESSTRLNITCSEPI